jgi:hypothetical protein
MSGFTGLLLGTGSPVYNVTIGQGTADTGVFGYVVSSLNDFAGDAGAINSTTFKGVSLGTIVAQDRTGTINDAFGISLQGAQVQSFFSSITVQKSDGTLVNLTSASASFSQIGGYTQWNWATSPPYWTSANIGQTKFVAINY